MRVIGGKPFQISFCVSALPSLLWVLTSLPLPFFLALSFFRIVAVRRAVPCWVMAFCIFWFVLFPSRSTNKKQGRKLHWHVVGWLAACLFGCLSLKDTWVGGCLSACLEGTTKEKRKKREEEEERNERKRRRKEEKATKRKGVKGRVVGKGKGPS
jgi:hypothetical protein